MKIYVYKHAKTKIIFCETYLAHGEDDWDVIQVIDAEPTELPITENFTTEEIQIGEVFNCNSVVPNLIRTA